MIHSFSAKNFYSFADKVSIDFTIDNKTAQGDGFYRSPSGVNISVLEAIIGPNASGKTTSLKALAFIKWLIVNAYRLNRDLLPFSKYVAVEDKDMPTELEVTFEMEGDVYNYNFKLNKQRILSEELRVRTPSHVRVTYKKLFSRQWNDQDKKYELVDRGFGLPWNYEASSAEELGNSSIVGAARRFGHGHSKKIVAYWEKLKTNVDVDDRWMPYQYGAYEALEFYQEHKESKAKAEKTVRSYDLGIDSFDEDGYINHDFNGKKFKLRVDAESSGTQQLLVLSRMIDSVLENGGVAVIDEFDAYLHPSMFKELLGRFLNPRFNPKHGQLLLSTHDLEVFNELKKYQILLAEKIGGATRIKRLDSIKGVRPTDNYRTKYLAGEYEALPKIVRE